MLGYLVRRLVSAIGTIFVVSIVVFTVTRLSGDPVRLMLPMEATQQDVEDFRRRLGFDRPLPLQYLDFIARAVRGDLGESLRFRQPALGVILERLPATASLAVAAMAVALVVAVPAGVLAAVNRGGWLDTAARGVALLGQALPVYWVGIML